LNLKIIAISLLVAISGWVLVPFPRKTVASQTKVESVIQSVMLTSEVRVNKETEQVIEPSNELQQRPTISRADTGTIAKRNKVNEVRKVSPSFSGRHYSKEEVQALIIHYSAQYGINSATPLCIAKLESGYNQFSKNSTSTASGVFQYLSSTWRVTDEGKSGLSVLDADANVRAAIKYMAIHKSTRPWVVGNKCPSLNLNT
jgi:Transglycosylase SLT domain